MKIQLAIVTTALCSIALLATPAVADFDELRDKGELRHLDSVYNEFYDPTPYPPLQTPVDCGDETTITINEKVEAAGAADHQTKEGCETRVKEDCENELLKKLRQKALGAVTCDSWGQVIQTPCKAEASVQPFPAGVSISHSNVHCTDEAEGRRKWIGDSDCSIPENSGITVKVTCDACLSVQN